MKRFAVITAAVSLIASAWPASAAPADMAEGKLIAADGKPIGTVTVRAAPKGVLLRIEAKGLTPGWHGVHFHEKADCAAPKFTSAGSHVHSATPTTHGLLNPTANDDGDLPNIHVGPDGAVTVELYSTLVALSAGGDRPALLDADGSALVIHAKPDDYTTQPIGGAGDRVACASLRA
jgi:superoxide dismutase, Cu-Zn family